MALGFFQTGDYEKAVETQERALEALGDVDSPMRRELEVRLEKYRRAAGEANSESSGDR